MGTKIPKYNYLTNHLSISIMSLSGKRKWFKKWHKWPSIILSIFILLFAFSGIILNHRQLFSSVDISRQYIPKVYHYNNWNLAAVKSSVTIGKDSILIYGNIGVWLTDTSYSSFKDYNQGFPIGIDNRKINSLAADSSGNLYTGTLFGLYSRKTGTKEWVKVTLPVEEERIVKVFILKDTLWVMTWSNLLDRKSVV